ncbi:MAG: hypothetical protein AAGK74_00115 [Chloroflexota bacterium]
MTATSDERTFFRTRLNGSVTSMPDAYIDAIFDEMEVRYAGYSRQAMKYAALIQGIDDLILANVTNVDYDEGDASEKLSQIVKALKDARANAKEMLDAMIDGETARAAWRPLRKKPRYRDRPSS